MITLLEYDNKVINYNEMGHYCSTHCKYDAVCDKKDRSFKLQSTIRAKEMYKLRDENIDYLDKPFRSFQMSHIVSNTIETEKGKLYGKE